ncbi:MAG: methyltransferase domain-containing protein, partial [Candidatus Fonsibacter sp.]
KSKVQNEKDICKNVGKYIILRLASVYGASGDNTRINILPNLFSKIASQEGKIKLFGSGKQLKSLVAVEDVVRCLKFMEESEIENEIFHLSNEEITVKEISNICKKIKPKVEIIETNDEIPNPGYSISNKKLLNTGFKFLYSIENSIKDMIKKWSYENKTDKIEYVEIGKKKFIDERGIISNYELSEPINLIGYIESKKGTTRANHFHPVQEQKCLLINGQYISVCQDLLDKDAIKITKLINPGDMVITKPNVAHTMVFTKDSILLNLVRGEREHENYGITHTISHKIVSEEEKENLIKNYKYDCRSCGSQNLKRFISLGYQPLANNLLDSENQKDELYPLEVNFCADCYNCQLSYVVEPEKMFSNYLYMSSTGKSFVEHFERAAEKYIKELGLDKDKSFIIDIGSNDGIALKPFKTKGFNNILGIEPAKNLSDLANSQGIKTLNAFLNKDSIRKINQKADLILASNVFAHNDGVKEMTECFADLVKDNGTIIIEVQYLLNTLQDLTFDNIYHEHVNYWSLLSLQNFFKLNNFILFKAEKVNTHGGSIRVYISKDKNKKIDQSVNGLLNEEKKYGLDKFETYQEFEKKVEQLKINFKKNIEKIKNKKEIIIGYGSPAKATTSLNYYGVSNQIDFIIEDNQLKQGKFLPGVKIPIKSKKEVKKKADHMIVLAWNFFDEIKKGNSELAKNIISIKTLEKADQI